MVFLITTILSFFGSQWVMFCASPDEVQMIANVFGTVSLVGLIIGIVGWIVLLLAFPALFGVIAGLPMGFMLLWVMRLTLDVDLLEQYLLCVTDGYFPREED